MMKYILGIQIALTLGCISNDMKTTQKNENSNKPVLSFGDSVISKKAGVVYISRDIGKTWQPFSEGLPVEATISSFIEKGNTIFASTEFHGVFMNNGKGAWQSASTMLPSDIHIKAIEVSNDYLVLGSSNYGIWVSSDEGKSWKQVINDMQKTPVRCLFSGGNKLFAGTDAGIFISLDNGLNWKHNYGTVQVNGFTIFQNTIYAGLMNGAIMSNDGGATWSYIYKPHTLHDISHDGTSIYAMTLGEGLLKSDNEGLTWQSVNSGMGANNLYTFEVKNVGGQLFAAQWIGIYHSMDKGGSWTLLKGGLPDSTAFCTLAISKMGLLAGIGLRKH